MNAFKHLLVPIDFSEASTNAFLTAKQLALPLEAQISVIHIHQLQVPYVGDGGFYVPEMDETEVLEERKSELAAFVEKHGEKDLKISWDVRLGDPESEINEVADELGVDMIIMGTHGRSGLSHLLMGSVTESVLRYANVPILAVRHK